MSHLIKPVYEVLHAGNFVVVSGAAGEVQRHLADVVSGRHALEYLGLHFR